MLTFGSLGQAKAVVVADSLNEYSGNQGENNWFYGYYDGNLTSDTFKLFPTFESNVWYNLSWGSGSYWTRMYPNGGCPNGTNGNMGRLPVEQWCVRRWVSEISGTISISGSIGSLNGGNMFTHVIVDGTEVFLQQVTESTYIFDTDVNLGSNVDFVISPNNHNDVNGDTKFTAVIDAVPEPSSLILISAGAISLLAYVLRRRRHAA